VLSFFRRVVVLDSLLLCEIRHLCSKFTQKRQKNTRPRCRRAATSRRRSGVPAHRAACVPSPFALLYPRPCDLHLWDAILRFHEPRLRRTGRRGRWRLHRMAWFQMVSSRIVRAFKAGLGTETGTMTGRDSNSMRTVRTNPSEKMLSATAKITGLNRAY
jgi:hypothetical protein